jgi:hypothetical protein
MTTSLVVPNDSKRSVVRSVPENIETWRERGVDLLANLETARTQLEMNRWAIGDWLVDGETNFGEKAYEEAQQMTGWTRGSLYNIVWVTRRFSDTSLRSETSTGLKWSHFKELARIPDETTRVELLNKLNDGAAYSVVHVRAQADSAVKKLRENQHEEKKGEPKYVSLQILLTPEQRDQIKSFAKQHKQTPDVFVRNIVRTYLRTHKLKAKPVLKKAAKSKRPKANKPA